MRLTIALLFAFAIGSDAGWYERAGVWIQSDSEVPWTAKGYTARTQAQYDAAHPPPYVPTPDEVAAAQEAASAPQVFRTPIEAPSIIVQSHTNAFGVALAADDQGSLVTAIVHQSPYQSTNAAAQIAKAFAAKAAAKATRSNDLAGVRSRADAANSVPALRAEVRRLAEIIEQMGAGQ